MQPTVTEQTGKKYKGGMLIGGAAVCVGVVIMISGSHPAVGVFTVIGGLTYYFVARIGAWWHHS